MKSYKYFISYVYTHKNSYGFGNSIITRDKIWKEESANIIGDMIAEQKEYDTVVILNYQVISEPEVLVEVLNTKEIKEIFDDN